MVETNEVVTILLRWAHITAGIFWIGLLYYFNVVQVPVFKRLDAATRSNNVQKLVPVALAWFRYSALLTFIFGALLFYMQGQHEQAWVEANPVASASIMTGAILGTIMLFNVWIFIWPNQKKIIQANREKAATGKELPPQVGTWTKHAFYASRMNFLLSFPMLFFMAGTQHFAGGSTVETVLGIGAAIFIVAAIVLYVATSMKPAGQTQPATPATPKP